jgi:hypothetical protein
MRTLLMVADKQHHIDNRFAAVLFPLDLSAQLQG